MEQALILFFTAFSGFFFFRFGMSWMKDLWLKFITIFSGAFLFGLAFLHILPEIFMDSKEPYSIGFWILGGFFIQLLLEFISKGIEHGHAHLHSAKFPVSLLIALGVHAVIEATPLNGVAHDHGHDHGHDGLFWGIILHKLPVSIVLAGLISDLKSSNILAFFVFLAFGLCGPLGYYAGGYFPLLQEYHVELLALVLGLLLHISTTILYESSSSHKFNGFKLLAVCIGFLIASLIA